MRRLALILAAVVFGTAAFAFASTLGPVATGSVGNGAGSVSPCDTGRVLVHVLDLRRQRHPGRGRRHRRGLRRRLARPHADRLERREHRLRRARSRSPGAVRERLAEPAALRGQRRRRPGGDHRPMRRRALLLALLAAAAGCATTAFASDVGGVTSAAPDRLVGGRRRSRRSSCSSAATQDSYIDAQHKNNTHGGESNLDVIGEQQADVHADPVLALRARECARPDGEHVALPDARRRARVSRTASTR